MQDMVAPDADLIELAYAAAMLIFLNECKVPWDRRMPEGFTPGELERECYDLAVGQGLPPLCDLTDFNGFQEQWRRQLQTPRRRDLFDLGTLLFRQHGVVSYLQDRPEAPERAALVLQLVDVQTRLREVLTRLGVSESRTRLPEVPAKGTQGDWFGWSGDELREAVLAELAQHA
jgi:hypothetical protein